MFRSDASLSLRFAGATSPCPCIASAMAVVAFLISLTMPCQSAVAETLLAGVAKVDITDRDAGPVNDPLYVKALVLKTGSTMTAIVTVDAVAIGGIGHIKDDYLGKVRGIVERENSASRRQT